MKKKIFFLLIFLVLCRCENKLKCPEGMSFKNGICVFKEEEYEMKEVNIIHDIIDLFEDIFKDADIKYQDKGIGSPCKKDIDCGEGLVCLDWKGGYCSILNCGECPQGSICVSVTKLQTVCFKECKSTDECRKEEGYGCKKISDIKENLNGVCYEVKENAKGVGEGCKNHSECTQELSCLQTFAGGYCAEIGCSKDEQCNAQSECILVNDIPTCLKKCEKDEDCAVEGNYPRKCGELFDYIKYEKVKVCLGGNYGLKIGEKCLNSFECESEYCKIVYKGKCSFSKAGCMKTEDCKDGGICEVSVENYAGFCSKECTLGDKCGGGSFCVGYGGGKGKCQKVCSGVDDKTCMKDVDQECIFGDPLGDNSKYVCAKIDEGSPGSPCKEKKDCIEGECFISKDGGYCISKCGNEGLCPFPMSCQKINGITRCYKRCNSNNDCPLDFVCKIPQEAFQKICVPQ